ncbi:TonB-dependent receptor [Pontibacter populi]|uniref:TonB-dependent receptor n=1 Tax=Pontibacter populi TaxID=890055 RepID=A0ABV1RUU4_9BACT
MKNKIRKASLAIVLCVGYAFMNGVQAQNNGWGEGAKLEDAEVVVEKNRVIELPNAARNFEKFKVDPPAVADRNVRYRFEDYRLPEQDIELQMRVLTIKQDELTKLYGNYLKAGFGNYATLYLKGYFHNKRSETSSFGANFSHVGSARGPEVKDQSAVSNSSVGVHGERYLPGFTIGGRLGYERDKNHFYGYAPSLQDEVDKDTTKQIFNRINAKGYIHNQTSESPFLYKAGVKLNYLNDRYDMSEANIGLNLNSEYTIDETSGFKVDADLSFVQHKDSSSVSRTFFKLNPSYERQFGAARVTIGANVAYTGDNVNDARQFNIYPQFRIGVEPIKDNLLLYAGLGGDLQRVTLYELTKENPWIAPNVEVADINKGLEVYGGFSANLSNYVHLTGRVAYQNYRNLYFYNNSRADSTKFDLVYDDGVTNVLNIYSEAVFDYIDEVRLGLKLDYNKYNTASLDQPFHRPELMASVFATYNFYDKILFNSELYYIGSSFGRVYRPDGSFVTQETSNIIDLNLKADYKFTNTFTVFMMANNILGNKYERFVNYPVKSINVIGGVTYSF